MSSSRIAILNRSTSQIFFIPVNGKLDAGREIIGRIIAKVRSCLRDIRVAVPDIARTAAQIATEKGLEIVFSEYRANLGAVDITADITARMATSSQGGTEREQ